MRWLLAWFLPLLVGAVRQAANDQAEEAKDVSDWKTPGWVPAMKWHRPPDIAWSNKTVVSPDIDGGWKVGNMKGWKIRERENMLIPKLMVPQGSWYQMYLSRKKSIVGTREYKWELEAANGHQLDKTVATLQGRAESFNNGHRTLHVKNNVDENVFRISSTHSRWSFSKRWSFRIFPPKKRDWKSWGKSWVETEMPWYTINKDAIGRADPKLKDGTKAEWRVYRGNENGHQIVYYIIGSFHDWHWWIFHNEASYENREEAVAEISQEWNDNHTDPSEGYEVWKPEKFKLRIVEGEDPGLLMAACTVMDLVDEFSWR